MIIFYIVIGAIVAVIWLVTWAACRAAALSDQAAEEALRDIDDFKVGFDE